VILLRKRRQVRWWHFQRGCHAAVALTVAAVTRRAVELEQIFASDRRNHQVRILAAIDLTVGEYRQSQPDDHGRKPWCERQSRELLHCKPPSLFHCGESVRRPNPEQGQRPPHLSEWRILAAARDVRNRFVEQAKCRAHGEF